MIILIARPFMNNIQDARCSKMKLTTFCQQFVRNTLFYGWKIKNLLSRVSCSYGATTYLAKCIHRLKCPDKKFPLIFKMIDHLKIYETDHSRRVVMLWSCCQITFFLSFCLWRLLEPFNDHFYSEQKLFPISFMFRSPGSLDNQIFIYSINIRRNLREIRLLDP